MIINASALMITITRGDALARVNQGITDDYQMLSELQLLFSRKLGSLIFRNNASRSEGTST